MYQQFAQVYDRLMDDFDYAAWADDYLRLIRSRLPQATTACECGCGTGNMTVQLARRGLKLTASDLSEDMLRLAQEKARRAGVSVPFVRQDMRSLALHRPVDAVIAFDVSTRFKLKEEMGDAFFGEEREDVAYLWQNRYDDARQRITMDLTFFLLQDDGLYRRFSETHVQRAHLPEELTAWLGECGFEGVTIYGETTFAAPAPQCRRIHIIAQKPTKEQDT